MRHIIRGYPKAGEGKDQELPTHKVIYKRHAAVVSLCGLEFKLVGCARVCAIKPEANPLHVAPIGNGIKCRTKPCPCGHVGGDRENIVGTDLAGDGKGGCVADGFDGGDNGRAAISILEPTRRHTPFKIGKGLQIDQLQVIQHKRIHNAIEDKNPVVYLADIIRTTRPKGVERQNDLLPTHEVFHKCGSAVTTLHCLDFYCVDGSRVIAIEPEAECVVVAPILGRRKSCAKTRPSRHIGRDRQNVVVAYLSGQGKGGGVADGFNGGDNGRAAISILKPTRRHTPFKIGNDGKCRQQVVGGGIGRLQ